jgi:2-polyprenyl-3-methyl-5-hydroxy-6-metoxy-1,4-benzoquinol methylase
MRDLIARGQEHLDEPGSGAAFAAASYRAMTSLHRLLGTIGTVRRYVASEAGRLDGDRPLRILDLGSGDCEVAEQVARWAIRRSLRVDFTCLDSNPHAIRLARRRLARFPALKLSPLCERVEDHTPKTPYDCAVGSLFFHHFSAPEMLDLLERLRGMVLRSVLISDLRRSTPAFLGFLAIRPTVHSGVWRDGLMSIRRGFRAPELQRTLRRLPQANVQCRDERLFRVVAQVQYRR